ncbi:hypothetical protein RvY_10025-1 [Ramazzottius varieornatus]|uniref:Uncharacterized protein n=1 Tax=Ramazzottius varieornatus TaxID=947166 RepID=A0A1D1VBD7_RAMVA|nr:hypothetical protein RvY_10025-1 [Ramazzottius varieornatus]
MDKKLISLGEAINLRLSLDFNLWNLCRHVPRSHIDRILYNRLQTEGAMDVFVCKQNINLSFCQLAHVCMYFVGRDLLQSETQQIVLPFPDKSEKLTLHCAREKTHVC